MNDIPISIIPAPSPVLLRRDLKRGDIFKYADDLYQKLVFIVGWRVENSYDIDNEDFGITECSEFEMNHEVVLLGHAVFPKI